MPSNHLILSRPLLLSQHQGLFQWVSCLHQVAKALELQLQHQSFQWIFRVDFLQIGWFDLLAVQAKQLTTSSAISLGFPCGSPGRESTCNAGDLSSIPGLGRSPGEGYPQQYSGLENSMDCIVYGVTKSRTRLNGFHSLPCLHPHSSAYHLPSLDIWNSRTPVGNVQILTTPFGPLWKSSSLDPKRK